LILKNDEKKVVSSRQHLTPLLYNVEYDQERDILSLDNLGYPIRLYSATENGELIPIYRNRDYDFLDVKGKTVIDIGANIADSSIYFAFEGAAHVIALEPYFKNYEIAKKNINLNNLNSKITLLNAGGGSTDRDIFIDSAYAGICKPLEPSTTGKKVGVISLNTLISKFGVDSASLKMDCEGCEYDIILNASPDILNSFTRIQIEYHYGSENLRKKLEKCGFKIKATKPVYIKNDLASESNMYVGYIYASRS
jgi:FkbM family methyltransferase